MADGACNVSRQVQLRTLKQFLLSQWLLTIFALVGVVSHTVDGPQGKHGVSEG